MRPRLVPRNRPAGRGQSSEHRGKCTDFSSRPPHGVVLHRSGGREQEEQQCPLRRRQSGRHRQPRRAWKCIQARLTNALPSVDSCVPSATKVGTDIKQQRDVLIHLSTSAPSVPRIRQPAASKARCFHSSSPCANGLCSLGATGAIQSDPLPKRNRGRACLLFNERAISTSLTTTRELPTCDPGLSPQTLRHRLWLNDRNPAEPSILLARHDPPGDVVIRTKRRNRELLLVLTEGNRLKARFLVKDLGYLANYAPFFIFHNRPVASKLP